MYICFAEYRIASEHREAYLEEANTLANNDARVRLYEGSDQLNLFVEVWSAKSQEEADQIKEERCGERSSWHVISDWIAGGPSKLHVWTFKPLTS